MRAPLVLILLFHSFIVLSVAADAASTIDGGTVIILDTSGSGRGQGVAIATDGQGLRDGVLRGLLAGPLVDTTKNSPVMAVITCGDRPSVLLKPTADQEAITEFARTLRISAAGPTSIDKTLQLLRTMKGQPAHIVYIGDGLLTRPNTSSKVVVRSLPAALEKLYGTAPNLHLVAVDSSGKVFSRTRAEWTRVAAGRVAEVRSSSDVPGAVKTTLRNLEWAPVPSTPSALIVPVSGISRNWLLLAALATMLTLAGAVKLRGSRARLDALITIEEDGRTRRTSASTFRKPEVSIGDGDCDVKVPKWKEPIRLVQRVVRDRRGRKRQQTIAQQGNRSVILSHLPASFSNGTTTVRVRGGRQ